MGFLSSLQDFASSATMGLIPAADHTAEAVAAEQANTAATNAANREIAQKQMDFQERMSNTAWQRGTADMAKAGINPILAATAGAASSPTGASIASQKADVTGAWNAASNRRNAASNAHKTQQGVINSALGVAKLALAAL